MKIFIEYSLSDDSGKGKFIQRLTKQWDKTGIKYSDKPAGCDCRLTLTRYRTKSKLPTVIRIDGAHNEIQSLKGKDKNRLRNSMKWKNELTAKSINKSKAVIWQSDFCRRMGHAVFKVKPKREYVIFNGDDPTDYLPWTPGKNVIMSAHWKNRPHKRLKEMLEVAENFTKKHPDVIFHVLGGVEIKYEQNHNIQFHGRLTQEQMKKVFATATCMLNICYADWCPNAVVEALVAGMPVICTANQGVSEIVKDSGIIVDIDDPIPSKHFKRAMNKPIRDIQPVYKALEILFNPDTTVKFVKPEHLYIEKVAKQYAEVFREILR